MYREIYRSLKTTITIIPLLTSYTQINNIYDDMYEFLKIIYNFQLIYTWFIVYNDINLKVYNIIIYYVKTGLTDSRLYEKKQN